MQCVSRAHSYRRQEVKPVLLCHFATLMSFYRDPDFFALVIGINDYKHISPLRGCVADADDMVDYLTNTLGVSPSRIINLRNEQASRREIKKSIAALASDDRIQPGNPILIFFAGHGAQVKAPHWAAGSLAPDQARIEMILPVDFKRETNVVEDWQGISDITLAALLSDLAKAKGDNIVRIAVLSFDCLVLTPAVDCHTRLLSFWFFHTR